MKKFNVSKRQKKVLWGLALDLVEWRASGHYLDEFSIDAYYLGKLRVDDILYGLTEAGLAAITGRGDIVLTDKGKKLL